MYLKSRVTLPVVFLRGRHTNWMAHICSTVIHGLLYLVLNTWRQNVFKVLSIRLIFIFHKTFALKTDSHHDKAEILSFLAQLIMHWYLTQDAFHQLLDVSPSTRQICDALDPSFKTFSFRLGNISLVVLTEKRTSQSLIAYFCHFESYKMFFFFWHKTWCTRCY